MVVSLLADTTFATEPDSDGALAAAAQGGSRTAFDQLVARYEARAFRTAYRFVANVHDAREIMQDAFVRAYRAIAGLKEVERFGPWLLRIVTNHALNFRRARANRPRIATLDPDDNLTSAGDSLAVAEVDFEPEARLLVRELDARVDAALSRLPARQRDALILSSVEQRPQREVAAELGCSVEAVKWHVFQARKSLRAMLADWW